MQQFLKKKIGLKNILVLLTFLVVSLIIYYPTLKSDPLWDDWVFLFKSWPIKNVGPWEYWVWGEHRRSWPVFFTTISLMYKTWGPHTLYYHLTSVFLYSCNGFLLYKVLKKLGGSNTFLITLLYLVHPLNFFTVSWIIQLKTIMCIFFFLISLWVFIDNQKSNSKYRHWISVFFFALSLLSKSAFAPIALLMVFYKERKRMMPYLVICAYSVLLTSWTTHIKGIVRDVKVSSYFISESVAEEKLPKVLPYVRPTAPPLEKAKDPLRPMVLSLNNFTRYSTYILYPNEVSLVNSKTEVNYSYTELVSSLIALLISIAMISYYWKKKDYISLSGFAFFLMALLPLTGIIYIPIFSYTNFIAYWLSVPVLGLAICLSRVNFNQKAKQGIIIFFIGVFSYQTMMSSITTPNPVSMITKAIDISPNNYLVELILSTHYRFTKEYEKSNEILFRMRRDKKSDREFLNKEIDDNFKIINGEKYDALDL
jgi:hypothetical protein